MRIPCNGCFHPPLPISCLYIHVSPIKTLGECKIFITPFCASGLHKNEHIHLNVHINLVYTPCFGVYFSWLRPAHPHHERFGCAHLVLRIRSQQWHRGLAVCQAGPWDGEKIWKKMVLWYVVCGFFWDGIGQSHFQRPTKKLVNGGTKKLSRLLPWFWAILIGWLDGGLWFLMWFWCQNLWYWWWHPAENGLQVS